MQDTNASSNRASMDNYWGSGERTYFGYLREYTNLNSIDQLVLVSCVLALSWAHPEKMEIIYCVKLNNSVACTQIVDAIEVNIKSC